MRQGPLRSTLFPYTTLFRSAVIALCLLLFALFPVENEAFRGRSAVPARLQCLPAMQGRALASVSARAHRVALCRLWSVDRKSTRLNSSHSYISYADICLKKK